MRTVALVLLVALGGGWTQGDDTSFGDVGIPAISKIRGFETPNLNRMAA